MAKEEGMLKDWMVNFLKNKDLLTKQIESIEGDKEGFDVVVTLKSGEKKYYLVKPVIESQEELDKVVEKLDDKFIGLVVLNKKSNLEIITEGWGKLTGHPKFAIYFVNPKSSMDKKWIIFPHVHEKVTEKPALKKGLKAMFETVEPWKG